MSKTQRLLIVLGVIAVAMLFLWPTAAWYFFTPKADQHLALGSREQIREYARGMAVAELKALSSLAKSEDSKAFDTSKYAQSIRLAKAAYADARKDAPKEWTARNVLRAWENEAAALSAMETTYRTKILDIKSTKGKAVKLGLDLSGGMSVVIQADLEALAKKMGHSLSAAEKSDAMKRGIEVLSNRIDQFGLAEPIIRPMGEDQIYVEMPGAFDPERINSIIMGKGRLAFHIVNEEATSRLEALLKTNPTAIDEKTMTVSDPTIVPKGFVIRRYYKKDSYGIDYFADRYFVIDEKAGLDGTHIQSAQVSSNSVTGQPTTNFQLDSEGGTIFYALTTANVKKLMAVVLDDHVKSYATIDEPIHDQVQMSGFSADEANNLKDLLRTAALPLELSLVNQQEIGASLGEDAVSSGILAVTIAFALVIGFMLVYYKGAGLNTAIAELVNLFIMVGVLSAFGLTLSLASIAGFVLTIGVSVDANVLIFERIKEELRLGKGRVASIKAGFSRAFWTIFDSHVTNLSAAIVLSFLGSGPIKGFAVSLAIGTVCSLFTSLFVSHLIFDFETDVMKVKHTSISWRVK